MDSSMFNNFRTCDLGKVLSFGDLLASFSPKLVAVFYENFHYFGSIIVEKLVSFGKKLAMISNKAGQLFIKADQFLTA